MFNKMFKEPNHCVMEARTEREETSDSLMISDPNAFDCCICFTFLTIPVFECDNGHVVCSTCCSKHGNECQKCFTGIGITLKRSRAIENLLQSIKISCSNVKHGCKERITNSGKRKHEEECIYVPCYCPILDCDFVASSEVLSNHFSHKHKDSRIQFSYDSPFFVTFKFNDEAIILQEHSVGKLFVLNKRTGSVGNAVNISCIGPPNSSEPRYYYDILVRSQKSRAKFHSFSKNVQRVNLETLSSEFLLIQFSFSEPLKLEICITPKMQIFVQTLTEKIIPLRVESSDTVASVKAKICDKEWFILHQHDLFLANKQLDDRRTMDDYDIQDKSILYLVGDPYPEENQSPYR